MSGGGTSVINASLAGILQASRRSSKVNKTYIGINGILGLIHRELFDSDQLEDSSIELIKNTPACAFGTCRYKLKPYAEDPSDYQKIADTFRTVQISAFVYIGGNDSQDTANKVQQACQTMNLDVACIGIPKTIDNDLVGTHCCPGYGSAAKYIATSTLEASIDVASMHATSTKVFVLEVMGRHAGWLAAASALARNTSQKAPHIILMPERTIELSLLLDKVKDTVSDRGYAVIVASEGIKGTDGQLLSAQKEVDAFGHSQLGGVAPLLTKIIKQNLNLKCHWAVADYLQRSARHIASKFDVDIAHKLGQEALQAIIDGKTGIMLTIEAQSTQTSTTIYEISSIELDKVANREKTLPDNYIANHGMDVTQAFIDYARPLVEGESYPDYHLGVPVYFSQPNKDYVKEDCLTD